MYINEEKAGVETIIEEGSDLETGVEEDENRAPSSHEEDEQDIDWKAVAEKERERAENYKTALTQKRQLRKNTVNQEDDEQDLDDKPVSRGEFKRLLEETVLPVVASTRLDGILAEKVKDADKREAVRVIYENRVRQTGTSDEAIRQDIDAAIAIADSNKVRKAVAEIERVQNHQRNAPLTGPSNERGPERKNHGFSEQQEKDLTARANQLRVDPKQFIEKAWKNSKDARR